MAQDPLLLRCNLNNGVGISGLSGGNGNNWLGNAWWNIVGRISERIAIAYTPYGGRGKQRQAGESPSPPGREN